MEHNLLTVPETCAVLRIKEGLLYKLLKDGKIRSVKIGKRRFFQRDEISRFIADLAA